jgi:hypothetical protein
VKGLKTVSWFFWWALATGPALAQLGGATAPRPDSLARARYDTTFIESYRHRLCVTLGLYQRGFGVTVSDPQSGGNLTYLAKTVNAVGLGIDYKWLTLELQAKLASNSPNEPKNLPTSYLGLQFGITGRRLWFYNFVQSHQGMYLSAASLPNMQVPGPALGSIIRPDLSSFTYFASLNYVFNHRRYSQMAALWQLDRQKRSRGTLVAGLSVFLNRLGADSLLLPSSLEGEFVFPTDFTSSVSRNLGFNVGYLHTFVVKKKFFLHLGLVPAAVWQKKSYYLEDREMLTRQSVEMVNETRLVLGYNGIKNYTGISFTNYYFSENLFQDKFSYLDYSYSFVRIFYGFRLKVRRIPLIDR